MISLRHPLWSRLASSSRGGQALLEFAFVAFLLVTLFAVTITLGFALYAGQTLQQTVDIAAQEIARMPFPPQAELGLGRLDASDPNWVMNQPEFLAQIYDPSLLVVNVADLGTDSFQAFMDRQPLLNRLLAPLMIAERDPSGVIFRYRYPGTVVTDSGVETVLIPIVSYDASGTETLVRWITPVEEIALVDGASTYYPFSLATTGTEPATFQPGMVALRINYPVQSAQSINQLGVDDDADGRDDRMLLIEADDDALTAPPLGRFTLVPSTAEFGPKAGDYGLGVMRLSRQGAPIDVRPYRQVLSVQAIYRREVFQ